MGIRLIFLNIINSDNFFYKKKEKNVDKRNSRKSYINNTVLKLTQVGK